MSNFMPHGHCYFWEPYLLWSHALSDGIIALAYIVIPIVLLYLYYKRKDFIYGWMVTLFAVFIFGCGITHVFDVINIWIPLYKIDSIARIITACASMSTAVVMIYYSPKIISLPTIKQWERLNQELSESNQEIIATNEELQANNEEFTQLNEQLKKANDEILRLSEEALQKSQEHYKELAESISDIFFALDANFCFTYWNKASEAYSGIKADDALGKNLFDLYPEIKGTPLESFYRKALREGKADKLTVHLGEKYAHRRHEINVYPSLEGLTVITVDVTELLEAKESVEEKKKELELALWGSDSGRWEFQPDRQVFIYDERYANITNTKRENGQILYEDWLQQINPEDRPLIIQKLNDHILGKTSSFQAQYRIFNSGKQYKWIMSHGKVVVAKDSGEATKIVGVIQDISEIKQTEEDYLFFKHIIDHTYDSTYWIDPYDKFRFAYVNKATCKHFGLTEEVLMNMSIPDLDKAFTYEKCEEVWELLKEKKSLTFETLHTNAAGEKIPVQITANYLKYADKEYITGYIRDIREQKKYQNKILELQQRLEGIIDSAMDAIITIDENERILIFNKAAEKMFAYDAAEMINQSVTQLIPFRHHAMHSKHINDFANSYQSNKKMGDNYLAIYGVNREGIEFPIEASISQTEVDQQKYFTVIMRDISIRLKREEKEKELNGELVRQNEQLQQFGYITSHNLRGPVATILGLMGILEMIEIEDEQLISLYKNVKITTEKMDEVLNDLNQILQYQNNLSIKYEWIDIEHIIKSVKIVLADAITKTDVEISYDLDVRMIFTNKSYLNSIFHNLISNAIKYKSSNRRASIHISTREEREFIRFAFMDNGIGIDLKKNKEKIFQLYQRFNSHVDGKGLGLYLVKTQVEALNGLIKVESTQGVGTIFVIDLPILQQGLLNSTNT